MSHLQSRHVIYHKTQGDNNSSLDHGAIFENYFHNLLFVRWYLFDETPPEIIQPLQMARLNILQTDKRDGIVILTCGSSSTFLCFRWILFDLVELLIILRENSLNIIEYLQAKTEIVIMSN